MPHNPFLMALQLRNQQRQQKNIVKAKVLTQNPDGTMILELENLSEQSPMVRLETEPSPGGE